MGFSTFHWLVVCPEHVMSSELSFLICKVGDSGGERGRDINKRNKTTVIYLSKSLGGSDELTLAKYVSQQERGKKQRKHELVRCRLSLQRSRDHSVNQHCV